MSQFINPNYGGYQNRIIAPPYNQPVMSMYNSQMLQQPMQQPIQQPQQPVEQMNSINFPISEVKFINADQIKGYIVDAGFKKLLIDKQNGMACLKWTDYSGESYERMFRFEDFIEEKQKPVIQPIFDDKLYVKREELQEFFENINKRIEKLSKQIKINKILEDELKEKEDE